MRRGTTPSQTVGPFFSLGLPWEDGPFVVPAGTPGAIRIGGRVLDGAGDPVPDALVETWQADPDGRFDHPDDPRGRPARASAASRAARRRRRRAGRSSRSSPGRCPPPAAACRRRTSPSRCSRAGCSTASSRGSTSPTSRRRTPPTRCWRCSATRERATADRRAGRRRLRDRPPPPGRRARRRSSASDGATGSPRCCDTVLAGNAFQRARIGDARALADLPLTTKDELLADQAAHPPFGTNLTFPLDRYTHLHQTSGSTGTTLRVLDTARGLGVVAAAARPRAARGGHRPRRPRRARVLVRALRAVLGVLRGRAGGRRARDPARRHGLRAAAGDDARVRRDRAAVHAELRAPPRARSRPSRGCTARSAASSASSAPASRARRCRRCASGSRRAWGARCFDHAGASEVGSFAYPCAADGGLHLFEDELRLRGARPATGDARAPRARPASWS